MTDERTGLDPRPYEPRVMPHNWTLVPFPNPLQRAWRRKDGLTVLFSVAVERDGKKWMHVSVSRRGRLPFWDEYIEVKELFCGAERQALQILAKRSEWVNIHPYVLHIWCCLDGDGVPDMRQYEPVLDKDGI